MFYYVLIVIEFSIIELEKKINTRGRKAKGKALEELITKKLLDKFPELEYGIDIRRTISSENGQDIKIITKKASTLIPLKIEAKSRATMAIYTYYEQAKGHPGDNLEPCVIIKMNRKQPLIVINLDYFLDMLKKNNEV